MPSPQLAPSLPPVRNLKPLGFLQGIKNQQDTFTFSKELPSDLPALKQDGKLKSTEKDDPNQESSRKLRSRRIIIEDTSKTGQSSREANGIGQIIDSAALSGSQTQLFSDEADQVIALIKRIMYAEGDLINLNHECAVYLKEALFDLSKHFKIELKDEEMEEKLKEKLKKRDVKVNSKLKEK